MPTESQLHMAYSVCRGITRTQAKNFYYGFLVLPRRKRDALCAVYAFMRQADDISDNPELSDSDKRQKLESWMEAFHAIDSGTLTDDPVLLALEANRARDFYKSGHELLNYIDHDSRPAIWVLVTIYSRLLEKIAKQEYNVFGEKVRLTTSEKLKVLAKGFAKRLT